MDNPAYLLYLRIAGTYSAISFCDSNPNPQIQISVTEKCICTRKLFNGSSHSCMCRRTLGHSVGSRAEHLLTPSLTLRKAVSKSCLDKYRERY